MSGTMLRLIDLLVLAVAVVVGMEAAPANISTVTPPPAFCRGLDCPKFTLVKAGKEYEVRRYAASSWVSTDIQAMSKDEASSIGFRRLYGYITGQNQNKAKIAMTCPVIVKVTPGQGPACESNFTESFMVPFSNQQAPAAPTEPEVYLSTLPEMTVYVRSFEGRAKDEDWVQNAADMAKAINNEKLFDSSHFYTAGYDSPFQLFNRHNEVWFIGK